MIADDHIKMSQG